MQESKDHSHYLSELIVSFGYQCNINIDSSSEVNSESELSSGVKIQDSSFIHRSSSFSCLSGAALSANFTLPNTAIYNEVSPSLDSPKSFRRMSSTTSLSKIDLLSSSYSSISTLGSSISTDSDMLESNQHLWKSMSVPTRVGSASFLNGMNLQIAGGAAGEDRVQAVCSEENGWLFCGIYDGFNGGDAADFLVGTLYDNIEFYLHMLESHIKKRSESSDLTFKSDLSLVISSLDILDGDVTSKSFRLGVLDCLVRSLAQAESDFLYEVEQAMEDRPDIVSVGSCVLTVLLHGRDLYVMNLGDSRAVLATCNVAENEIQAIQLTEIHTVDNELEYRKIVDDHPCDPSPITDGRVKGKLKLSRAFGVGYLKKKELNDALMGILRVRNLIDPPYVYTHPFAMSHQVSESDLFVVLGSDGLFDFFQNEEVVKLVHQFIQENPLCDPAKHLIEQLVLRAAESAGFSTEQLMRVPAGSRRKYHDDVTVIVIILGKKQRTSTASTSL